MSPEDLYGLPLDRFTPERNALAKALRQEGERQEADRVSKLPKPSIAAWAVNQLVRTQRSDFAQLLAAGDALQKAQSGLITGGADPGALRRALQDERAAVEKLLQTARGLLSSEGHELTPPILGRVAETLHAAALDPTARDEVQTGCLDRERRHVGLGAGDLVAPTKLARRVKQTPSEPAAPSQRGGARKAQTEARHAAERAERELETALERRDQAAQELAEAEEQLKAARRVAREAEREARRAQRRLGGRRPET